MKVNSMHVSRTWTGDRLEVECPCPKGPCGFAILDADSTCDQHGLHAAKTIRRAHADTNCPGGTP